MSEKTEKATAYHLKKAKEQGRVSKSIELNTSLFLLIMLAVGGALWPSALMHTQLWMARLLLLNTRLSFSLDNMIQLQDQLLSALTSLWLPVALAGIISIVLCTVAQTGFVLSFTPIAPDFKRLNIIDGCKRLFTSKLLFDACKHIVKLSLACLLLYVSMKHELSTCLHVIQYTPVDALPLIMHLIGKLMLQLIILLLTIALIDKLYTRWKFAKDNRMSKQDIKDEYRQREGDPKIKLKVTVQTPH